MSVHGNSSPTGTGEQLVSVTSQLRPFSLLIPGYHPARGDTSQVGPAFGRFNPELGMVLNDICHSRVVALDYETNGLPLYSPEFRVVGVGLAWDTGSAYWDLQNWDDWQDLLSQLISAGNGRLIAHNVYYDGGVCWKLFRTQPEWLACTYGLYMQLATESFRGQKWGLKAAQSDLLGWKETNEIELDSWLIDNNYVQNTSREQKEGYYFRIVEGEERWLKPRKAEMWRAPQEVLGKYCILDAESCYLLYTRILSPVMDQFPDLKTYHARDFLHLVDVLIRQHQHGISVDGARLAEHRDQLGDDISAAVSEFRGRPEVAGLIGEWEKKRFGEFLETEPEQFRKFELGTEPVRVTKKGTTTKSWEGWNRKREAGPILSKNWEKWEEKRKQIISGEMPEYLFNLNSDKQLRELLYDQLGFPVELWTEHETTPQPALNEDALGLMGDLGKILVRRNLLQKEREYVESYISLLTPGSLLHPSFRVPGTVTGRLSGKDPNIQQIPKTRGTLECFIPRPGHIWVDCDVNALEQVVLAELSGDPSLLKLYGPGASPNDVYLFVGSQFPGEIGRKIRAAGYDPDNPTPDGIKNAKKQCKNERSIAKVVVLASSYGAGANKIHRTLRLSGVNISEEAVQEIHRSYWEIFSGVRKYGRRLESEWRSRGGWVLNGVGRPVGVAEEYKKDIVNRVVQSTGHDILVKYIRILSTTLDERNIPWQPIVIDFHDESLIEVPEIHGDTVKQLMEEHVYARLNTELGGLIPLRGSAVIARNLADVKLED